jgi:ABC-type transport system involved in cytochrome bd biosynthesis fused ATPase/permease subunit
MRSPNPERRRQRSTIFNGLLLFQLILILLQLWLFVSALESLIDGKAAMAIPAAFASVVCLAVNGWMLVGTNRLDKQV